MESVHRLIVSRSRSKYVSLLNELVDYANTEKKKTVGIISSVGKSNVVDDLKLCISKMCSNDIITSNSPFLFKNGSKIFIEHKIGVPMRGLHGNIIVFLELGNIDDKIFTFHFLFPLFEMPITVIYYKIGKSDEECDKHITRKEVLKLFDIEEELKGPDGKDE